MAEEKIERPTSDDYTNAWYAKQFHAMKHHYDRCMVEEAQLSHEVKMLRKELREMSEQRKQDMAKIGEMQERLDAASKVVADLKKGIK